MIGVCRPRFRGRRTPWADKQRDKQTEGQTDSLNNTLLHQQHLLNFNAKKLTATAYSEYYIEAFDC